jgi:uncharacterized membrane protein YfcA
MLGALIGFGAGIIFYPVLRVLYVRLMNKADK